jgi:zinc protease
VRRLADEAFGKLPPHGAMNGRSRPQEPEHSAPVRVKLEDTRAGRMTVQRYYLAPSYASAVPGEAEALDLLMRIAASGPVSRLYKRLVIEQKTAASSGGWYSDSGLDAGRIAFYAIGAEKISPAELEQAIDGVIAELREGGVTQAELDRARSAYLAELIYTSDSQSRMARHYGWRLATGMTVEDVEAWPERLKQVTVENIRDVARKYLVEKNSVTGILVPVPDQTSRGEQPAHAPVPGRS